MHKVLYGSDHTILFKFHQHVVQIMYGETFAFQSQHQHYSDIKCPIRKSIFAVARKFAIIKFFRATAANADIGSLKTYIPLKMFVPY